MREKLAVQKSIGFPQELADEIEQAAETLNTNFSVIVRECVTKDLPKLIEREKKKRTRRRQPSSNTQREKSAINVGKWLK